MEKYNSKYKIEFIEWVDSFGCSSTWAEIKPITTCLICQSIGFVISETEDVISLANSISHETNETIEQAIGTMTIPKVSIKKRYEIK